MASEDEPNLFPEDYDRHAPATPVVTATHREMIDALEEIEALVDNFPPVGVAGDVQKIIKRWRQGRGE